MGGEGLCCPFYGGIACLVICGSGGSSFQGHWVVVHMGRVGSDLGG